MSFMLEDAIKRTAKKHNLDPNKDRSLLILVHEREILSTIDERFYGAMTFALLGVVVAGLFILFIL